jgi:hypothetical protein
MLGGLVRRQLYRQMPTSLQKELDILSMSTLIGAAAALVATGSL